MDIWLILLLQIILIALNAVFACAEIAVLSVSETKLEKMESEGNKKAKRLRRLTKNPAKFLATIQVAITLSGFLGSAFAADGFAGPLSDWLRSVGLTALSPELLETVCVIAITLILSFFTLVLGELVPKRVAMRRSEKVALGVSSLVTVISKLFAPLVWLLTVSTNLLLRLLGIDPNQSDEEISEEDIRLMVDAGSKKGAIDDEESAIIQNVFEFDDLTAGEISTHRTETAMLWLEDGMEEWDRIIRSCRHTNYPICGETVDTVVGVLNAKEYFALDDRSRDSVMENAVKPAYFVPAAVKADVLFRNMKATRNSFAIVLDEYGGVSGIITVNDLLEQIVGNFDLDSDEEESTQDIEEIPAEEETPDGDAPGGDEDKNADADGEPEVDKYEKTWKIKGSTLISDVEETLGISFSDNDCDTFGGYVLSELGSVPEDGTVFEIEAEGLIISVTEIADRQIVSATVRFAPPAEDDDEKE